MGESDPITAEDSEKRLRHMQKKADKERKKAKAKKKQQRDAANVVVDEAEAARVATAVLAAMRAPKSAPDQHYAVGDFVGRTKSKRPPPVPATDTSRPTELPRWAPAAAANLRGRHQVSEHHFTGVAVVSKGGKSACVEGFLDSGAGTTLWDMDTAQLSGLEVKEASPGQHLGTFWGAGSEETAYAGIIEGPITLQWSPDVTVTVPHIMVIHSRTPLVLWGTDVMSRRGTWTFETLGYNHEGTGVARFRRTAAKEGRHERREIALLGWPVQYDAPRATATAVMAVRGAHPNSSLAAPSPLAQDLRKVIEARGQRLQGADRR